MSTLFDFISGEIERRTDLARLEARGTVRLALKEAGFEADAITAREMSVVLEKIMPGSLVSRGVSDAESVCSALAASRGGLNGAGEGQGNATPERLFAPHAGS